MIEDIPPKTPPSTYQPSQEIKDLTAKVKKVYSEGIRILNTPWQELNYRSVLEDENRGQMMFNAFVDTSYEDPNEAWKWRGTRSMARNKGIAMHAQLTANYLLPLFVAQNENDEVDKGFSEVMRDIIDWMAQPINSNYQSSFIQIVFGMMSNPITYLSADFFEVMQTIKEKQEDGSVTKKEILDEVLSGFRANVWSSSQILFTNAYERNIQKQSSIIKRRYTDYSELKAIYGGHPNWKYVTTGIKSIYSYDDDLFYDIKDDSHQNILSEEIYINRREDTEIPFVNGIYFGDEGVESNPIKHRDNHGAPKYNVVPFGYHPIGEHFVFYKSMMNSLGWDNMLYDAMSEVVMNRALLEVEMPYAVSGTDKVDSDIIFPNAVTSFEDKDTKITPLLPGSNMSSAFLALNATKDSMEDSSLDEVSAGKTPEASQKAYNVAQSQANAKKMIGAVAKSLASSIIQFGDLMKDIAINHITVPQVSELVGGAMKLKYKSFFLEGRESNGKMVDRTIKFDETLIGAEMTDKEKEEKELNLLEESGYPDKKNSLVFVNPEMFAKFKYLAKVDVEEMLTKNAEYWQPVLSNLKAQLAEDPFVNQEALTRKLMQAYFHSEGDDLMQDPMPQMPGMPQEEGKQGNNAMANQVNQKQISNAVTGASVI